MERFSPKIEIINHFDNLINRIDIDIDSSLEKFNDQQFLSELLKSSKYDRNSLRYGYADIEIYFFDTFDFPKQNLDSWTETIKIVDYLKQIRMKTIEELKKAQEETLEYYKLNSDRFKTSEKNIDELRSQLFSEKFYFQIHIKQPGKRIWAFNTFTFFTDFYMSPSDIDSLEKLINNEKEPLGKDCVFDNKMILTCLLYKCFIDDLLNFPDHVIYISKQEALKIESINFTHDYSAVNLTSSSSTIDLSKLVELFIDGRNRESSRESVNFSIEGLSSLRKLYFESKKADEMSIRNLPSLKILYLIFCGDIYDDKVTRIFDQIDNIQELYLKGNLSYFNLDSLVNLSVLELSGTIAENFNIDLFKNLCNQLEELNIYLKNIEEKTFIKLFDGCKFPYLADFTLMYFNMKRLKKEFIKGFPMLRQLIIIDCNIEVIEKDAFSNLEQLCWLNLRDNRIECIEKNAFSKLKNLRKVNLSDNNLTNFDPKFVGLRKSTEFSIENKDRTFDESEFDEFADFFETNMFPT